MNDNLEIILRNRQVRRILETPIKDLQQIIDISDRYIKPSIVNMYSDLHENGFPIPISWYLSNEYGVNEIDENMGSITFGVEFSAGNPKLLLLNDGLIGAKYLGKNMVLDAFGNGEKIIMPSGWVFDNLLLKAIIKHEKNELVIFGYELEKDPRLSIFGDYSIDKKDDLNIAYYTLLQWAGGKWYLNYENSCPHERLAGALAAFDFGRNPNLLPAHNQVLTEVLDSIRWQPPKVTEECFYNKMSEIGYTVAEHYGVGDLLSSVKLFSGKKYFDNGKLTA
jgi:hypothetical protein